MNTPKRRRHERQTPVSERRGRGGGRQVTGEEVEVDKGRLNDATSGAYLHFRQRCATRYCVLERNADAGHGQKAGTIFRLWKTRCGERESGFSDNVLPTVHVFTHSEVNSPYTAVAAERLENRHLVCEQKQKHSVTTSYRCRLPGRVHERVPLVSRLRLQHLPDL